jgi:hypothetical protein
MVDHAALPDRSLPYHPATIACLLSRADGCSARPAPVSAGSAPLRAVCLQARGWLIYMPFDHTLQCYESDCWLVNESTQRLSYERAGSRPCCALVQSVTGGAQAAPIRGNSATEFLLDPWLTASYGAV